MGPVSSFRSVSSCGYPTSTSWLTDGLSPATRLLAPGSSSMWAHVVARRDSVRVPGQRARAVATASTSSKRARPMRWRAGFSPRASDRTWPTDFVGDPGRPQWSPDGIRDRRGQRNVRVSTPSRADGSGQRHVADRQRLQPDVVTRWQADRLPATSGSIGVFQRPAVHGPHVGRSMRAARMSASSRSWVTGAKAPRCGPRTGHGWPAS